MHNCKLGWHLQIHVLVVFSGSLAYLDSLSKLVTFIQNLKDVVSQAKNQGKSLPNRRSSMCKGLEVGRGLVCLRSRGSKRQAAT